MTTADTTGIEAIQSALRAFRDELRRKDADRETILGGIDRPQ